MRSGGGDVSATATVSCFVTATLSCFGRGATALWANVDGFGAITFVCDWATATSGRLGDRLLALAIAGNEGPDRARGDPAEMSAAQVLDAGETALALDDPESVTIWDRRSARAMRPRVRRERRRYIQRSATHSLRGRLTPSVEGCAGSVSAGGHRREDRELGAARGLAQGWRLLCDDGLVRCGERGRTAIEERLCEDKSGGRVKDGTEQPQRRQKPIHADLSDRPHV